MLHKYLPNRDKENVDVVYFKNSNSGFHNVLKCSGITINFIREYLIHYYIKKVCFLKESMFFYACGILNFKPWNRELLSAESKLLSAEFKLFLCRFLGGLLKIS